MIFTYLWHFTAFYLKIHKFGCRLLGFFFISPCSFWIFLITNQKVTAPVKIQILLKLSVMISKPFWVKWGNRNLLQTVTPNWWLNRLHYQPVLVTILIQPTNIVYLCDLFCMSCWRETLCCISSLSTWKTEWVTFLTHCGILNFRYIMKTCLTESRGSFRKVSRTFFAAFCLASFLFLPSPGG